MSNYTETAVSDVSKECFADVKEYSEYVEFIVKQLSSELAERVMGILEREEEIIVGQTDLRVSEFKPTNSVEYRRQINWSPLVRCKDCKHYSEDGWGYGNCYRPNVYYLRMNDHGFCSWGERREDGQTDNR